MDPQRALQEGEVFVKNAEEVLARPIAGPDQLYVWDNQVEVIDTFLADTEDLAGESGDLQALRGRLRGIKEQLERKILEVEAKAEGLEPPGEDATPEELVATFEEAGPELLAEADGALKKSVASVEKLHVWEEPLAAINAFLADSEPLQHRGKLGALRRELKARKAELRARIDSLLKEWRQADLAGGEGAEEGEE